MQICEVGESVVGRRNFRSKYVGIFVLEEQKDQCGQKKMNKREDVKGRNCFVGQGDIL